MRTPSMPSVAIRRTAAARIRSRPLGLEYVAGAEPPSLRSATGALIFLQDGFQVPAHAVGEPRDRLLAMRQRAALVATRLQTLLHVCDEVDVLVGHELVHTLVHPLRHPRPGAGLRWT